MINTALNKIKTDIEAKIPKLKGSVKIHGGRFSLDELKNYQTNDTVVLISALQASDIELDDSDFIADYKFGVFAVAGGNSHNKRTENVNKLVAWLLPVLHQSSFENCNAYRSANLSASNMYSSSLDKQAVSIWAITFNQKIKINQADLPKTKPAQTLTLGA